MNVNNPAGKNWGERRPRRRPWKLGQGDPRPRLPESLPAPGQLEHRQAAGRNWVHERPERRPRPGFRPVVQDAPSVGPLRERGGGDHDLPYRPATPSAAWTFPFSARQYGRLLALRSLVRDGALADDRHAESVEPVSVPA
jgi:hypothetical protein